MDRLLIYGIVAGAYSDYGVVCLCASEQDAEDLAQRLSADEDGSYHDARVAAFPLVAGDVEPVKVWNKTCAIDVYGACSDEFDYEESVWPFDLHTTTPEATWSWLSRRLEREGEHGHGRLHVRGVDPVRVAKVYADRRAMLMTDPAMRLHTAHGQA